MKKFWIKLIPVSTLAVAILASACSDQVGPDRDQLLTPESAALARGGKGGKADEAAGREKRGPKVRGKKKNGEEKEYRLATKRRGKAGLGASAWVDETGGTLSMGGHTLIVPAGAVSEATKFSMRESQQAVDSELVVLALDLNANRGAGRRSTDVGAAGFAVPVTLCVAYDEAVDWQAESLEDAALIWIQNVVQANEAIDSWVVGNQVCASLDHFSLWALGWP